MNSYTATYLQKLLSKLGADLTKTIAEQGLRNRNDALPFFMKEVRWLDPGDSTRKDTPFRRALFAPTGCGKTTLSLAYARALAKLTLKTAEDNDVEFIRKVAEKPCMEGMLEAGTPVIINARRSMAGDSPRSFQAIIDESILAILDQRLEADGDIMEKRLIIIDNLDQIRDDAERLHFVRLLKSHLESTDDSLLLLTSRHVSEDALKAINGLPGAKAITFEGFSDFIGNATEIGGLKDYLAAALDSSSAEFIANELIDGKLSGCLKNVNDLLALTEIARAQRPLPMTRRDLYEEYADVILTKAIGETADAHRRHLTIEKLAMLCSQTSCRTDASEMIRICGFENDVEAFCKVNDESEWEFKSQTLQSFLTTQAIEHGIVGKEGQVGIDALLLVKDRQIKSEAIDFLSVALHPDQQVLLLDKLGADTDESNLALAYLPKPESAEAANILYGNRFEKGVYLSDAWIILSAHHHRHRNAIKGFLRRHDNRGDKYTMLKIILQLQNDSSEGRVTFSWIGNEHSAKTIDASLGLIAIEWLRINGVSVDASNKIENEKFVRYGLDKIRTHMQGMPMLPNASSGFELIEMVRASA